MFTSPFPRSRSTGLSTTPDCAIIMVLTRSSRTAACSHLKPPRDALTRAEGSTVYLYSETAVPAILENVGRPRFIVALRNPIDLIVSYHRTQLVTLNENEWDFATAWQRSLSGVLPPTNPLDEKLLDYPRVARLGAAMERLLSLVPEEDVHVILFESLVQRPAPTWRELLSFAQLPASFVPDFAVRNASDKMYRSRLLRQLTHRPPRALDGPVRQLRQWSRTTNSSVVSKLKRSMWRGEERPAITQETRRRVRSDLRDDIELLSQLLRIDLSQWR